MPLLLAEACLRLGKKLVHISTGCLYQTNNFRLLDENKEPDFYDLYYSRSKVYAEKCLQWLSKNYPILILRIRIPLDDIPHPKNILTKLLKYKTILDCPNSITYIPDFISAMDWLIYKKAVGLFNVVSPGICFYPEMLNLYEHESNKKMDYKVISLEDFPKTRTNLLLSTSALEAEGFHPLPIYEVYSRCIKKYVENEKCLG